MKIINFNFIILKFNAYHFVCQLGRHFGSCYIDVNCVDVTDLALRYGSPGSYR